MIGKFLSQRFLTYLIVGGLTFLLYFGFITLTVGMFHLDYRVGVSIAYVFAVSFHFLANRMFTFQATHDRLISQSIRYVGVLAVNYLITMIVVTFFVGRLGLTPYLSAAFAIVITVGVGYFASKFWVFRKSESLYE